MSIHSAGILGSGFGLYGYMPAAVQSNFKTVVLSRYKQKIATHPVLSSFLNELNFVDSESELLHQSDLIVFARTPELQFNLIKNLSDKSKVYFFEKPLTQNVFTHGLALKFLEEFNYKYSVNYAFMRTSWYKEIISHSSNNSVKISIDWEIQKPQANWKIVSKSGGGLFHYYGIHFAPIFKKLCIPIESIRVLMKLNSIKIYTDNNCINDVNIRLGFSDKNKFNIKVEDKFNYDNFYEENFGSPFGVEITKYNLDPRINGIIQYYNETEKHDFFQEAAGLERFVLKFRGLDVS